MNNKEMIKYIDSIINELEGRLVKTVTQDKCIMGFSSHIQDRLNDLEELKDDLKKKEI